MKCHYDVLGVARDASDDDLKKNYRKLALKWHPDKNLDNSEEAKEQFQIIQQAFEVLSDPQERAWYDAHREAILKGGLGSDFKDDSFDVFPFFTSSCYKGFGDDDKGFYAVYREVFNKIAAEEADFMDGSDSEFEIPSFGKSTSDYEKEVHAFYALWQSFSTRKSYAWLDQYDTRQAENRRVVRAMEKENKKLRDKARKDRNEEIRTLVAFVRKRDKRVELYKVKLAERAKENSIKAENSRKRQLAERKKMLQEYKDPEALKMENMESVLKEMESQLAAEFGEKCSVGDESDSEEDVPSGLFCVACNKNFKTDKAFANHENSKKHKENIAALKLEMEEEEQFGDESVSEDENIASSVEELVTSEDEIVLPKQKNKKNKKKNVVDISDVDSNDSIEENESLEDLALSKKQRRRKEAKNQLKSRLEPRRESAAGIETTDDTEKPADGIEITDSVEELAAGIETTNGAEKSAADIETTNDKQNECIADHLVQKSKGKRAKAAKQAKKTSVKPVDAEGVDISHVCVKCNSTFNSRNKLFDHFKKTGHSVPLVNSASSAATVPTSKAGERRKKK